MLYQRRILNLVVCMAMLLTVADASADDGKLSGTITLNGKPLPGVRITFHLDKGEFVGTTTTEEGEYTVSRVPVGVRKITVEGKGVPPKYASENTSSLSIEIKKGSMVVNLALD